MAGAMRFTTNALVDLEAKIASAADRALALELDGFERLRLACLAESRDPARLRRGDRRVDVVGGAGRTRGEARLDAPAGRRLARLLDRGGRHPVVEAALKAHGEPFVANDCDLSGVIAEGGRIAVVTGPNMAGKSTYLRQNALIALIAQMGAYVPAARRSSASSTACSRASARPTIWRAAARPSWSRWSRRRRSSIRRRPARW